MKTQINAIAAARIAGVIVLGGWHLIWLSGAYAGAAEGVPRTIAAIVSLLVGTSFSKIWDKPRELSGRRVEAFRGVTLVGFALAAANLYFVHAHFLNMVLSVIAITMIVLGALAQRAFVRKVW